MKKEEENTAGNREGTMKVSEKHYNYLWRLIQRLERELLQKGVSIEELDRIEEQRHQRLYPQVILSECRGIPFCRFQLPQRGNSPDES